ncbi:MAG TPA: TatD family hydrolase, partial [Candidatus Binatia bacterium]|nr:TatD family hydrolase [Candidatus Binatia bacterium]
YLDLGFYLSFTGIITFKNAEALRQVVRRVPLERILVETDSPYLTPVPHRGKRNEPAYVRQVAETIATVKGVAFDQVATLTTNNARTLFKI